MSRRSADDRLPGLFRRTKTPAMSPAGFMMCPSFLMQHLMGTPQIWYSGLYQLALEQALAAARPSLPERDLLAVWN